MNVFIAEDSEIMRNTLRDMLNGIDGVTIVGEASDGLTAKEMIGKLDIDVAILDIRMPGENGIGILITVKDTKPDIKTIMLTNYPYYQYRKMCMDAGADYFLDKSKDMEKVIEILNDLK